MTLTPQEIEGAKERLKSLYSEIALAKAAVNNQLEIIKLANIKMIGLAGTLGSLEYEKAFTEELIKSVS